MNRPTVDQKTRIIRTLKQAVVGLLVSSAIALVAIITNVANVEFADNVWWPIASTVLTALTALLMNLKGEVDGEQDPS